MRAQKWSMKVLIMPIFSVIDASVTFFPTTLANSYEWTELDDADCSCLAPPHVISLFRSVLNKEKTWGESQYHPSRVLSPLLLLKIYWRRRTERRDIWLSHPMDVEKETMSEDARFDN